VRGGVTTFVGAFCAYLLMAHDGRVPLGVPLGILFVAIATFGVMDLVGSFDDTAERVAGTVTLSGLARPLATTAVALLVFAISLAGAAAGVMLQGICGAIVTLAFIGLVVSVFQLGEALGPWATDELGARRPIWQRHGFWAILVSTVLLLPLMGYSTLWDPWETHYGEVAREMLARDDWISLWWAQDGWFFSKPVLDFWIQAIFMASLGVHYQPGQMLHGLGGADAHPEWVVRAPVFLLTVLAVYILYKGVAKVFGRRAGLIGAIILATMPDWWSLAHQTMTDMPFVAPITAAMGLMLLGLYTPADEKVRLYEVRVGSKVWRLSAWHLVFGAVLLCSIPQILYLFSRNLELVLHGSGPHGFRAHFDEFRTGSGMGNCGEPGNEACNAATAWAVPAALRANVTGLIPSLQRFFGAVEPSAQAAVWSALLGILLLLNWGERRARQLLYLGAWFFAALATMAKGPAGFGLPILCGLAYVAATRRWSELVRFQLVSGLCMVFLLALPWWVAMFVRHGPQFTDRLFVHDMVDRAFSHVHDTNEGDDTSFRFYIWQLGYALFPWTGLAPLGLVYSLRRSDTADKGRGEGSVFLLMWFVFSFALFSFMGTKFHHYILPAVPPVAMLLGITLDDLLGEGPILAGAPRGSGATLLARATALPLYLALLTVSAALAVVGVARAWPGSISGDRPSGDQGAPSYWLSAVLCAAGVGLFVGCIWWYSRRGAEPAAPALDDEAGRRRRHEQLMVSGAAVAGALLLLIVGRDFVIKPEGADQPGAIRIVHLFTYNYRRPWPDALDYSAILTGFALVGAALGLALAVPRIRKHIIVGFTAFSMVWAVWGLDVYMVNTARHWGQHELLTAYYADRTSPDQPIVAYQMNWKGENFYSGNRLATFVSSGAPFTAWIKQQRDKGIHTVYVVAEHGRLGALKGELQGKGYKEITDKTVNNKFVLLRADI
jgi:4-amino-4-deoxy-L-arabinose transferase-like glycosyltransferase